MICFGLNQGYLQFGLSLFDMHDQWLLPPVPAKAIPGLIEGPAFMGWAPGTYTTHKVGRKTKFDGNNAVQQGHDCGYLIPHFAIPMNVMVAINMLVSKHKVMFPVTKVLIEGKPLGTYFPLIFLGLICSNPVSLPTGALIMIQGTVISNMTLLDIFLGFAFIAVDIIIDAVWSLIVKGDKWGKFGSGKPFPSFYKGWLEKIFSKTMVDPKFTKPLANLITRQVFSKVVDHIAKSWIVSPLISGSIFQATQPLDGVPRTALPSISVGRAGANISFFPKFKIGGNVFN
jgi:hypothetical protein